MPSLNQPRKVFRKKSTAPFGAALRIRSTSSWDLAKHHNGSTDRVVADHAGWDAECMRLAQQAHDRYLAKVAREQELAAEVCAKLMISYGVQDRDLLW